MKVNPILDIRFLTKEDGTRVMQVLKHVTIDDLLARGQKIQVVMGEAGKGGYGAPASVPRWIDVPEVKE